MASSPSFHRLIKTLTVLPTPSSGFHLTTTVLSPLSDPRRLRELFTGEKSEEPVPEFRNLEGWTRPPATEYVDAVDYLYKGSGQAGVGMGEGDEGVTFGGFAGDPLMDLEVMRDVVSGTKERRHGVPFFARTTGLVDLGGESLGKGGVGLKGVEVFLPGGDPSSYAKGLGSLLDPAMTGSKAFQLVCAFVATSAEAGLAVTAAVRKGDKGAAELGRALGAGEVKEY